MADPPPPPPPLAPLDTSFLAPPARASTPPHPPPSTGENATTSMLSTPPPPTFTLSPADDENEGVSPAETMGKDGSSPTTLVGGGGHRNSESLDGADAFVGKTSLGLRDNVVDTEAKRQARDTALSSLSPLAPTISGHSGSQTAYSPSEGHSEGEDSPSKSKGNHNRRPSAALSFASTVPDHSHGGAPSSFSGNEKGDSHLKEREKNSSGQEEGDDQDNQPGKWCGIIPRKQKVPEAPKHRPDPSPSEMAPFPLEFTPSSFFSLLDPKSPEHLASLGGPSGILSGLKTTLKSGLPLEEGAGEKADRKRVYGENRIPEKKAKGLLKLMWMAYQDKVLLILSVAAIVSLALGLYQDLGTPPDTFESTRCAATGNICTEPQVDWVEGVAITIAILIVVMVGAVNDYQKERQFQKLNKQKEERNVKAVRGGKEQLLSVYDVLVGDILVLEPGEIVPVDGVFLEGYNVKCDESGATGESDLIRKVTYDELEEGKKADCFMLSGAKVVEGVGKYVVTGVGESSFNGRLLMAVRVESPTTPLQLKLNALAELIAKLGAAAGIILFSALMIRFFVQLGTQKGVSPNDRAQNFIQILIIAVTIVVVAVPEGLPLAVTLALAFATRRMTKQNLLVRVLSACETMANATVICTDKTGTLTTNQMSVVAGSIGVHLKFADRLAEHKDRTNANDDVVDSSSTTPSPTTEHAAPGGERAPSPSSPTVTVADEAGGATADKVERRQGRLDFSTDMSDIDRHLSPALRRLFNDSIVINSTAFEGTDEHGTLGGFVGSKTETALLAFGKNQGWENYKERREAVKVVQMIPFSSERKAMGVVVDLGDGKGFRLLLKGASEVLAKLCGKHVVVEEGEAGKEGREEKVRELEFTDETRSNISRTIIFYANQSLRTIALCSRDLPTWPPTNAKLNEAGEVEWEDLAKDLTLVAITAIEDPLREGVTQSVATCQKAGVQVKMCTGDNVLTARSIATQCGIFTPGGIIMEGPVFRKLSDEEANTIVPRLQVLARSSPQDKLTLVNHLKRLNQVVAVSGDGSNDAPALKAAHVGFSMGIAGTEVAKEASDIVVMDDNFGSMVTAIMWGRCVNDSVKKFLQFQISVNITAVVITFITAVASSDEESVLTAVQLLWVNLIMDTFAALALATDPADVSLLDRQPDGKTAPLITPQMWMMITGQAIYQTIVALVLHFAGHVIFNFHSTDSGTKIDQDNELKTLVFNTFVFCQIFNQLNARRLDRGLNVFTGIHKNVYFIAIFLIMVGGQALIINFGGASFQVTPIGGRDWGISLILGALSLPLAILIRCLPPGPFERFMIRFHLVADPNLKELPTNSPESEEAHWNQGITKVIDNLNIYSQVRGGRLRSSSIVGKSRHAKLREQGVQPMSLLAMVPSLVVSSVGAGWKPTKGSLMDPAANDPSRSSAALYSGAIQVHEGTPKDDPLAVRFNMTSAPSSPRMSGGGGGRHSRQPSAASARSAKSGHSRGSSLTVPPTSYGTSLPLPSASH